MMESLVAVVKGSEPRQMVNQALKMINAKTLISPSAKILVKPNCVFPKHPSTGTTTDSKVVEGIIEFLIENGVTDITIGDGGNKYTDTTFDITGIRDVAKSHEVKIVNFNNDGYEVIEIPFAKALHQVPISKTVLESDCIVNVPKLKIHHMAQVTLAIKNLMGVIVGDRGAIMHKMIDDKLVDLASYVKPKLNVIDGIVGSEMDETHGYPVSTGVVVAGENMVSIDAVASAIMGLGSKTIRHITKAAERGLGIADLDKVTVIGASIESVMKKYRQGFSLERLKKYGFDCKVGEEVLRPLWERVASDLPTN